MPTVARPISGWKYSGPCGRRPGKMTAYSLMTGSGIPPTTHLSSHPGNAAIEGAAGETGTQMPCGRLRITGKRGRSQPDSATANNAVEAGQRWRAR